MEIKKLLNNIERYGVKFRAVPGVAAGEIYLDVNREDFSKLCMVLHKELGSPVRIFFAEDDTAASGNFVLYCGFESVSSGSWVFARFNVPKNDPAFPSLSKEIFSANLFEREIAELFGITPSGNPDTRRLRLHDEVWPEGFYPLKKDFASATTGASGKYKFKKIEGEGVFEVPVGPVHAGIIGPGHFRFSAAGEPVINLELRLGFTHRGVEKMFEGKTASAAARLAECVSGDSVLAHCLAFCGAVEKISDIKVPEKAAYQRCVFLELERMYNHASDIGAVALDVGYSFPNAYAQVIKEHLLRLNEFLTGSRYLKSACVPGGASRDISEKDSLYLSTRVDEALKDFKELKDMLCSSASFMDRLETAGVLEKKTAEDLGVTGPAARASGIDKDLRCDFPGPYFGSGFRSAKEAGGDALARLNIRIKEFEESARLVKHFAAKLRDGQPYHTGEFEIKEGFGMGYAEGWRGPVLYWVRITAEGKVGRCKIVDPSFNNWQGLAFAMPGNIIPDFPLCNKSFNLSYPGNDL